MAGRKTAQSVGWAVTPEKIDAAVKRLVEVGKPSRIILFGSAARGEAHSDSDVDLLVVMPGDIPSHRRESVRLRSALLDISMPMDILVISEQRLREVADRPGLIYREILRTGKVVYESHA